MGFTAKQPKEKLYTISLKSKTGNTVGFINLSQQFLRAVIHKDSDNVTVADLESIKLKGVSSFEEFLSSLTIEITEPTHEVVSAEEF